MGYTPFSMEGMMSLLVLVFVVHICALLVLWLCDVCIYVCVDAYA